jgi:hypothetical protein
MYKGLVDKLKIDPALTEITAPVSSLRATTLVPSFEP